MKKEKTVKTYQRRTKSGKIVTVRQHTAKYDAAEALKEAAKKKGAGNELEAKMKRLRLKELIGKELPEEEVEKKVLDEDEKGAKKKGKIRPVGTGTNGPEPKKSMAKSKPKKAESAASNSAFTAAEFKEWYHGTGSAADKKVAKALRAQLGRAGYRKLEDEAIDNYSSRGHLSMFKRVSGGSEVSAKKGKSDVKEKAVEAKTSKKPSETRSTTTKRTTSKGDYTPAFRDYVKKSGYELNKYGVLLKGGKPVENGYNIIQSFAKAYRSGSKPTLPKQSSGRLTAVEKAYADYHKEQGRKGKPDYSSEEFMDFASTYKKQGSPRASKKTTAETGGKKGHKVVPKSSYKKYKEDPAYERRLEKDPKFASSEAVKGAKAELRGYGKQTPASIARQYGKDSKEYKGYMKLYSTPVPKDPKKAAVRNAVLQGFGRAGDDTCRDLLVANGYPHTHAYSKGVKEITALAKKYGIDW